MPEVYATLVPQWRPASVQVPGCLIEVREPTYGEMLAAASDQTWWACCIRFGGKAATAEWLDAVEATIVKALIEDVCRPRPTVPQPGGCGD